MEGEEKNNVVNNLSAGIYDDGFFAEDLGEEKLEAIRRKERLGAILVITVGVTALLFGLAFFVFDLRNPFSGILLKAQKDRLASEERQRQLLLVLQTQDTDKDGLTDYDELNKYSTSPYLADSDGDGFDDKSEISRGTDPNCPEGQVCFVIAEDSVTETPDSSYVAPGLASGVQTQASPTITASFIRSIMLQTGMKQDEIDALSDQEIMAEFSTYLNENPDIAQALAEQGYDFKGLSGLSLGTATTTANQSPNNATTSQSVGIDLKALGISSVEDLKKLSGTQIRQLMIDAGASADLLSSVSDEQLKDLFIKQIEAKAVNQ